MPEIRSNEDWMRGRALIRISSFGFPSGIVIRHSSFQVRFHPERAHQKSPPLRGFLDDFAGRLARAMASAGLDADQDGSVAALRGLERRRIFETVSGHHPVVVVRRRDKRGGIFGPRL